MTKNMGKVDRILRTVIALVLLFLVFTGQISGAFYAAAAIIAAIFLLTSLVGFCPLYRLVGMNTCPRG